MNKLPLLFRQLQGDADGCSVGVFRKPDYHSLVIQRESPNGDRNHEIKFSFKPIDFH